MNEGRRDETSGDAQLASVMAEVTDRLRRRGVALLGNEKSDEVAPLVEAVERFDRAVEAHGGDLMVDSAPAREPDNPEFVLPSRRPHEPMASYLGRIDEATTHLRQRHPG